jgi:ribosome biogenesis GTPase
VKRLTKKQKDKIKYTIRDKFELKQKAAMLNEEGLPRFLERRLSNVRRLARNLDQLLIVASFEKPPLKPRLIDRFLVLCEIEKIEPVIILNKTDLVTEKREIIDETAAIYKNIGYAVYAVSAKTKENIDELKNILTGKRSALAGHSGVGKSSIINAMMPHLEIDVNEVSEQTSKGRHTTTSMRIYNLPHNTEIIDLPGIKILDFIDIHKTEARLYYREFSDYADGCKFRDCTHIHEKECAVKEAVENGEIHPSRYDSYCAFTESLE